MEGVPLSPSAHEVATQGHRPDIQALRALAVGSVLLYHLWPLRLTGGYVGVDVFFVVSGFLITSHLLRELESTGTIRLGRFWARRAVRLLPSSLLVLALTAVGIVVAVPKSLWTQFLTEVGAAALYVQNWELAANSVDYLASGNVHSPVLHFWTLSVEEQFYVGLPLLLLLAVRLVRRRTIRRAALTMVTTVVGLSFAYSVWLTNVTPSVAYLSTLTRAWEFGAGALMAFLPAPLARWRWARFTPLLGVCLILLSVLTFSDATAFPGFAAALPVTGSMMTIWGGRGSLVERLGRIAPIALIGRVSYSIYLWHWPVIVIGTYVQQHPLRTVEKIGIAAVTLGLAWATTTFIEDPVRFSPKLLGGRRPRTVGLWSVGGMALVLSISLAAYAVTEAQLRSAKAAAAVLVAEQPRCFGAQSMDPELAPCQNPVLDGAPLVPALAAAADDDASRYDCWAGPEEAALRMCTLGPATGYVKHLVALGDSHNNTFVGVYARIAEQMHWRIDVAGHAGCYWTDLPILWDDANATAGCRAWRSNVAAYVAESTDVDAFLVTRCALGRGATPEEVAGMVSAWGKRPDLTVPVIAILDNPWMPKTTTQCLEQHPTDGVTACAVRREDALFDDGQAAATQEDPHAATIDLRHLYCTDTTCPPIIGDVVVYRDDNHLTATYASTVAPYMLRSLILALGR